jgi:hypothetical protein
MTDFVHSRFAPTQSLADVDLVILGLVMSSELPMDSMLDLLEPSSAILAVHGLGPPFAAAGSGGSGHGGADRGDGWP